MKMPSPGRAPGAGGGDDRQDVAPDIAPLAPFANQPANDDLERILAELQRAFPTLTVCALRTGVGIGAVVVLAGAWRACS
jgi:hypothetical protein